MGLEWVGVGVGPEHTLPFSLALTCHSRAAWEWYASLSQLDGDQ